MVCCAFFFFARRTLLSYSFSLLPPLLSVAITSVSMSPATTTSSSPALAFLILFLSFLPSLPLFFPVPELCHRLLLPPHLSLSVWQAGNSVLCFPKRRTREMWQGKESTARGGGRKSGRPELIWFEPRSRLSSLRARLLSIRMKELSGCADKPPEKEKEGGTTTQNNPKL